jgi:hypothetical protein
MALNDNRAKALLEALGRLDDALAEQVGVRWEEHERHTQPLLVVFGEQNSGKTALVARLLIDAGQTVPTGLTIGARPESTSGECVEWKGWRILDLPGIGSERRGHDETAWEGVELADAILLVMPPKLLTGEGLAILPLINGSWFTPDDTSLSWTDELVLVVGQADTGPEDLELFPDAAPNYRAQLRTSLDALLAEVGGLGDSPLYMTAPSPNAILDHAEAPTSATFDGYRSWDGMAELSDALQSLAHEKERLRGAAATRFLLRNARLAIERAADDRRQLEEARDRSTMGAQTRRTLDAEIDSVISSTEVKLKAVLTGCCAAVYDRAPAAAKAPQALRDEFAKQAEAFEREFAVEVDRVIAEATRLIDDLPAIALSGITTSGAPHGSSDAPDTTKPLNVDQASKSAVTVVRSGVEFRLGASIDAVRKKLKTLDGLDGDALEAKLKAAGFKRLEDAEAAKRLIGQLEKAETAINALPHLAKLGSALWGAAEKRLAKQRSENFAKNESEYVAAISGQLMNDELTGFRTRLETIRTAIQDMLGPAESLAADLEAALGELDSRTEAVRSASVPFTTGTMGR